MFPARAAIKLTPAKRREWEVKTNRSLAVVLLGLFGVLGAPFEHPAYAREFTAGDEVVVNDDTPLKSGQTTLMTVPTATEAKVIRLYGEYALVEVAVDGNRTRGWVDPSHLSSRTLSPVTDRDVTAAPEPTAFTGEQIDELHTKSLEIMEFHDGVPEGWTISKRSPESLLPIFTTLNVKRGYILKTYLFGDDGNSNGMTWAMPHDAEFPDPNTILQTRFGISQPTKPNRALDNVMEAIEGDGSALSYLQASMLQRELNEFGSGWHGCDWTMHTMLGADPWTMEWDEMEPAPSKPETLWRWAAKRPEDWCPRVSVDDDKITVTFYTYCILGKEAVYEHVDVYKAGEYRCATSRIKLAEGPRELCP